MHRATLEKGDGTRILGFLFIIYSLASPFQKLLVWPFWVGWDKLPYHLVDLIMAVSSELRQKIHHSLPVISANWIRYACGKYPNSQNWRKINECLFNNPKGIFYHCNFDIFNFNAAHLFDEVKWYLMQPVRQWRWRPQEGPIGQDIRQPQPKRAMAQVPFPVKSKRRLQTS